MNVIWLKKAEDKYFSVLDYLAANFSINAAISLNKEVEKCVEYLEAGFQIGTHSKKNDTYKCVVKKHNLLIYKFKANKIVIVNFVPARSNHGLYEA